AKEGAIWLAVAAHSMARKRASVEETLMSKTKQTFAAAALCGGLLALAPGSGALAVPVAPIGKAATAKDSRSVVYYYRPSPSLLSPPSLPSPPSLLVAPRSSPRRW